MLPQKLKKNEDDFLRGEGGSVKPQRVCFEANIRFNIFFTDQGDFRCWIRNRIREIIHFDPVVGFPALSHKP